MSALSLVSQAVISVSFVPLWQLFSETLSYRNLDRQGGKTKRKWTKTPASYAQSSLCEEGSDLWQLPITVWGGKSPLTGVHHCVRMEVSFDRRPSLCEEANLLWQLSFTCEQPSGLWHVSVCPFVSSYEGIWETPQKIGGATLNKSHIFWVLSIVHSLRIYQIS